MAAQYLTRNGASRYLTERGIEVKPQTLRVWACNGRYRLPYVKIGRIIRYDVVDLDGFIASHRVTPGEAASESTVRHLAQMRQEAHR